ncbi:MAG: ABC-F family ATP-binding cassette domain-containing protein [Labilithrix sp.]|nr:ABC-F family ATP-binding cassette domain-containing protein [Labilithrix sp.]MCW5815317.1 ABC-F family ATP-binding cassette domain-containing protein [Labilithrix sp.]
MSVLAALDVDKAYGERVLLAKASLTIDEGERVGVVGRNGAGKSTFAKILAGVEPADGGTIALRRGARVAFLAQEPDLDGALSVRATVERGLDAWLDAKKRHDEITARIAAGEATDELLSDQLAAGAEVERLGGWDRTHEVERVLHHLGVGDLIERAAGQLSGGQRRRVALAQVLVGQPDVMILDEPTNHLDADTIDWLEKFLADEFRGAVLFVTHDRWLLDRIADRTIEVERGQVYAYEGGYAAYLEAKAERMAMAERTEKNRQNFLRTELEWLRRQPKARTTKQKARIERAEEAKGAKPVRDEGRVELGADVAEAGKSILDVRGFTMKMGERVLVRSLDLAMTSGERLGILGPNGAGKTTLMRAILAAAGDPDALGKHVTTEGTIGLGRRVRVGYLDQERASLDPDLSIFETVARAVPSVEKERVDPRSYLERFMFDSHAQRKKVGALSGGERARLALAQLLASAANLLLLDEPSNDLDTDTLSALEEFLSTYEGSLLVVTHDRYLLDRVTTGILSFEGDGRVTQYAGAYQAYAAARARAAAVPAKAPVAKPVEKPKPSGLSKNEQRELDGIMDQIDAAEQAALALEAELGAAYAPGAAAGAAVAVQSRLDEARAHAAKLTARWEQLEAKKSGA